jgi:hypothetical protein
MSRPAPTVILENINKDTYKTDQILASEGIWAVVYNGKPINLKTSNYLTSDVGPRYRKTSFSNKGHAVNLSRKLNKEFHTDKFTVVLMNTGKQVYPDVSKI